MNLLKIGRFEPSSKTCSCGVVNNRLKLSDREWACTTCWKTTPKGQLMDPYEAARTACQTIGIEYKEVPPDGKIYPVPVAGKPATNKSGRILVFTDAEGGITWNKATGERLLFWAKSENKSNPQQDHERAERIRLQREQQLKDQEDAAAWCAKIIPTLPEAPEDHPYLVRKRVKPHGIRIYKDLLAVPIHANKNTAVSIQFISADGDKNFKRDAQIQGNYYPIGRPVDNTVVFAEGFATAATIHQETGHMVACCFNAGNLQPVAEKFRALLPDFNFIIAADNDRATKGNPGLKYGLQAAEAVGARLCWPDFPEGSNGTDFNDLEPEEVRYYFELDRLKPAEELPPMPEDEPPSDHPTESPIDEDLITQLARMSKLMYDQCRKDSAKTLAIRTAVLDELVKARKKELRPVNKEVMKIINELNEKHFVAQESGKTLVYQDKKCPLTGEHFLEAASFKSFQEFYLNQKIEVDEDKYQDIGSVWLNHSARRTYLGIVLNPRIKGHYDDLYNLWQGFEVEPKQGNWSLLQAHLMNNVCNGNAAYYDYLLKWMATAVQHPDDRAGVAVILRGGKGVGKSIVADHMRKLFGRHGTAISNSKHLTGQYNEHQRDKIFLFADEAFWAGDKQGEGTLKARITEPTITIEGKFKGVITVPNMLHIMMAANAEWVVPASKDERRYFILDVADHKAQQTAYFNPITAQMNDAGGRAAMLYDLLNVDLKGFEIRNIPATDALTSQKLHSLDDMSQWWLSCLEAGSIENEGWESILTTKVYDSYLATLNKRCVNRRSGSTNFGIAWKKLLPEGWPKKRQITSPTGERPYCYDLPPLRECREFFSRAMKADLQWEEVEGDSFLD